MTIRPIDTKDLDAFKSFFQKKRKSLFSKIPQEEQNKMVSLIDEIKNTNSPDRTLCLKKLYLLTEASYQNWLKTPPSVFTRIFNWNAWENSQKKILP